MVSNVPLDYDSSESYDINGALSDDDFNTVGSDDPIITDDNIDQDPFAQNNNACVGAGDKFIQQSKKSNKNNSRCGINLCLYCMQTDSLNVIPQNVP